MSKIFWISICAALFAVGCSKDKQGHVDGQPMTIDSFTPDQGDGGKSILITGSNFSSDTAEIEVTINGNKLTLVGANTKQIMAVVPKRCGSGPITVKIGGSTVTSTGIFNYIFTRTVSTLAGNGTAGFQNGKGEIAQFNFNGANWYRSNGIITDNDLNVYVADPGNHCIRKITPDGVVSTFAGSPGVSGYADGKGTDALFSLPYSLSVDEENNIYVADPGNWDIRKISPDGTAVTIGWAPLAPWNVAYDKVSKTVYHSNCDYSGNIYKLQDGASTAVIQGFVYPAGMAFDNAGHLFISGHGTNAIHRYSTASWQGEVIAGKAGEAGYQNGAGTAARFSLPWGLTVDNDGNVYVAGNGTGGGDAGHIDQSIRLIQANTWQVSTLAGSSSAGFTNGIGGAASFNAPGGVAVDKNGTVYVLDKNNNSIRKIISE